MITLELMTKKECCLCEYAKDVLDDVLPDYPVQLTLTDIEQDPALMAQYQEKIPVLLIEGEESFIYKIHPVTLRKKLEKRLGGASRTEK